MTTALRSNEELSSFCFQNDQIVEGMISLLNHSYEETKEIIAVL